LCLLIFFIFSFAPIWIFYVYFQYFFYKIFHEHPPEGVCAPRVAIGHYGR